MKLLVTGGAGFIGCNFIEYLLRQSRADEIICLDSLTYAGNMHSLAAALRHPQFRFVRGSIADRAFVLALFEREQFDVVVNFAAESHVDRSIKQPQLFLETNVMGTACLLEAAKTCGVKRYHQVSTDEVYGDLPL
ncbi:MAG: GDP-mannose 4,6-dehydratase, partial [Clostridia bacterium]|nr:GDP-mannose 4,6-dehydratase [Clostridia bacterium]